MLAGHRKVRPLRSSCLGDFGRSTCSREPSRRDFGRSTGPIEPSRVAKVARRGRPRPPTSDLGTIFGRFWCRNGVRNGFVDKRRASGVSSLLFAVFSSLCKRCSRELAYARIGLGHCILRYETHVRLSRRCHFRCDFCAKLALELQAVFNHKIDRKSCRK